MLTNRQRIYLVILGAVAGAAGVIVVVTARGLDIHLLGAVCILGGLAMLVVALPTGGGQ